MYVTLRAWLEEWWAVVIETQAQSQVDTRGGDLHPFLQRLMCKELLNEKCKHSRH